VFGSELLQPVAAGTAMWSALLAAPFVGSFLGVRRLLITKRLPIAWSRSRCEWCGAALRAGDLMPLYSWLAAGGRCRYCAHSLGWFYPGIELAAIAVPLTAATVDHGGEIWLDCLLGWWLLALAWIDIRRWLLPDPLTLPLVIAGLVVTATLDPARLTENALGAATGYLSLRVVASLYRVLRGREGLGRGDAKLLAASGAWVGAGALPQVVLGAAVMGLFAASCLQLAGIRLHARSALPFGPFLALATWLVWLFGPFLV